MTVNRPLSRRLLALALGALLLSACASDKPAGNTLYDFGSAAPTAPAPASATVPALVVTDATGSAALDNERMVYRLDYADPLQARSYANSRWSATPLQMITQRFKVRIAQAGTKVLSSTDASNGVPILRVEVDDFTHGFDSLTRSQGRLVLRASLFQGHQLIDQKTFSRNTDAVTADAAGGARALAASTDAVAADIVAWLGSLSIPSVTQR